MEIEEGNTSTLSINAQAFNHENIGDGDYHLGSLTWVNHSNWHTGGTWNSIMTLDLALMTAGGLSSSSAPVSFSINNTTDLSADTDLNEATGNVPDVMSGLVLDAGAFSVPVRLGNGFQLTNVFFALDDPGSAGSGWTAQDGFLFNGNPAGSRYNAQTGLWENREGGVSTIGVYGTISAVPLPAGVWLMLSALGSAFMLGRRRGATT